MFSISKFIRYIGMDLHIKSCVGACVDDSRSMGAMAAT